MNKNDFIFDVIGASWVDRSYSMKEHDCFGLVYLYMSKVLNIVPELTDEYLNGVNFSTAFQSQLDAGKWIRQEVPDSDTIVFMMFAGEVPAHCGVMIDKVNCLHAFGNKDRGGQTVIWKLSTVKKHLRRYYNLNEQPRVEFYKWES